MCSHLLIGPFKYWKASIRSPWSFISFRLNKPTLSGFLCGKRWFDNFCDPPLDLLQQFCVFPVLRIPELDVVLQLESQQNNVELLYSVPCRFFRGVHSLPKDNIAIWEALPPNWEDMGLGGRKNWGFQYFFIFLSRYFSLEAQLHYKFPVLSGISGSSVWKPGSQRSGFMCLLMQNDHSAEHEGSHTIMHQEKELGEEYLPFINVLSHLKQLELLACLLT